MPNSLQSMVVCVRGASLRDYVGILKQVTSGGTVVMGEEISERNISGC